MNSSIILETKNVNYEKAGVTMYYFSPSYPQQKQQRLDRKDKIYMTGNIKFHRIKRRSPPN